MKKRITAMVLAVAMCCTLLVAPASAADRVDDYHAPWGSPESGSFPAGSEDGGSWALWTSKFDISVYQNMDKVLNYLVLPLELGYGIVIRPQFNTASQYGDAYWNYQVDAYGVGSCSLVWLTWWADILTNRMNEPEAIYQLVQGEYQRAGSLPPYQKLGLSRFNIAVRDDPTTGYKRLYDYGNGAWVVDSNGLYPFYAPSTSTATTGYQWLRMADVSAALTSGDSTLSMTSRSALSTICDNLSSELGESVRLYTWDDHFQCAYRRNGALILCDNDGNPLMCPTSETSSQGAIGGRGEDSKVIKNPHDGGGEELQPVAGNETQLNYYTYNVVLPNGNVQSLDSCYFDNDGDVYVIQAQQNGFFNGDISVNIDARKYYTYNYTYNISYSYVYYLGSTEQFEPAEYQVYYTLPDGRSSADLTKEELEQLNLSLDVINYNRSTEEYAVRALYHFDGNTNDSSAFNDHQGVGLTWQEGSSLNYIDSGAFDGALYLDDTAHKFTVTLGSSLLSSDFTIQWRMYSFETALLTNGTYFSIDNTPMMYFTGTQIKDNTLTSLTQQSIGNWQEYALIRSNGVLYYYRNGVKIGEHSDTSIYGSTLSWTFDGDQQRPHYFDELRVLNSALVERGNSYEPTSVPYDSNLVLVLPDFTPVEASDVLIDEYWRFTPSSSNFSYYDLTNNSVSYSPLNFSLSALFSSYSSYTYSSSLSSLQLYRPYSPTSYLSVVDGFTSIRSSDFTPSSSFSFSVSPYLDNPSYLFLNSFDSSCSFSNFIVPVSYSYQDGYSFISSSVTFNASLNGSDDYTFSIWDLDGDRYSLSVVSSDLPSLQNGSFVVPRSLHSTSWSNSSSASYSNGYGSPVTIVSSSFYNLVEISSSVFDWGSIKLYSLFIGSTSNSYTYLFDRIIMANNASVGDCGGALITYFSVEPNSSSSLDATYFSLDRTSPSTLEKVQEFAHVDGVDYSDYRALAVRSDIPVSDHQLGGVRPSLPLRGEVYAMVEGSRITSLQQYNGQAWTEVEGRIWTGLRWIPFQYYDLHIMSDMYDIADASGQGGYEYIYSQQGFWAWLQKWLMQFKTDLFEKLNSLGSGSSGECKHSYSAEVISDPACTESGSTRYTCSKCGDIYTEAVSPLGHDYVASEVVEDHYSMPDGAACPECGSSDFTHTLDADTEMYHCVCSDCDEEFDVDAEFEYGYTVYTCTRCDEEYTESNKSKSGLFEAIGDFLADGIQWIGDKLVRLVDAFSGLSDIFRNFAESVKENAGGFPTLFGQVFALIPEDLQTIIWFSLIASIVVAVWKKWFS